MPGVLRGLVVVLVLCPGAAARAQGLLSAEYVARALVIGQAYESGNVYVAGFVDDEPRPWPRQIEGVPLEESRHERIAAEFYRTVAQDSEEHYYFPQREGDLADKDLFTTIDKAAVEDRNLARYRAPVGVARSVSFLGLDTRFAFVDISYRDAGTLRPLSEQERKQVAAEKASTPAAADCSTEPRFFDSAKVVLTAKIAKSSLSIRLSSYLNPGCAGHLSEVYLLDVMSPGQPSRRFEFRHYHGVL
jgi:hypothetical protein